LKNWERIRAWNLGKAFEIENWKIRDEHEHVVGVVVVATFVVAAVVAAALLVRGCDCL